VSAGARYNASMNRSKIAGKILYGLLVLLLAAVAVLLILPTLPFCRNIKTYAVLSGSMEPAVYRGSVVLTAARDDYSIGEIITFTAPGKDQTPVTHRIKDIKIVDDYPYYITQGDANNTPDLQEVPRKRVIGKVLFSVPLLGYAVMAAKTPIGFATIIILPAAAIIGDEALKIFKEVKKNKKKKKEGEDVVETKSEKQNPDNQDNENS